MGPLIIPFGSEARIVLAHYAEVERILHKAATTEEREDDADRYMAGVLSSAGLRVYEAVLTLVAVARGIPPKDVPRPTPT